MTPYSAAALVIALAACAKPTAQAVHVQPERAAPRPRDLITAAEFVSVRGVTVYDAIRQLRPEYLNRRGGRYPTVYVDDNRVGGIEMLRQTPLIQVAEIRHMNSADATTRFGTGNTGGAILIVTGGRR